MSCLFRDCGLFFPVVAQWHEERWLIIPQWALPFRNDSTIPQVTLMMWSTWLGIFFYRNCMVMAILDLNNRFTDCVPETESGALSHAFKAAEDGTSTPDPYSPEERE